MWAAGAHERTDNVLGKLRDVKKLHMLLDQLAEATDRARRGALDGGSAATAMNHLKRLQWQARRQTDLAERLEHTMEVLAGAVLAAPEELSPKSLALAINAAGLPLFALAIFLCLCSLCLCLCSLCRCLCQHCLHLRSQPCGFSDAACCCC